ncbi:DNA gyrase inhibitor YacG [Kaistia dalseonensis]|nr:DNA gyrase inhibitor YacG [Kaistia dalseonensis]MCX5495832.1 DNA gyrase inhibitor YacG [Kaistia dalseonensis]
MGAESPSHTGPSAGADAPDKKAEGAKVVPLRPPRPCPICGRESMRLTYPFCSKRCADIDLNQWLSGGYAIAAVEDDGDIDDGEDEES